MPQVTVVIPSYNHARFLRACVSSVQNQTFHDWEILLIDDGSKDESVELARRLALDDPRVRVLQNEQNLGTYGTQQKALELSSSEYVAVLNSDDLWAPTKLRAQLDAFIRQPDVPLAYVLGWKVNDQGEVDTSEDVHEDWPVEVRQDILPYLLYENRVLASGVLFRREGLKFDASCRYSGDWVALISRSRNGPVACVPERLTYWRMHDNNTFRFSVKQMLEEIRVREGIQREQHTWLTSRSRKDGIARGLALNAMNLFVLYIYVGDIPAARKAILVALRHSPNKLGPLKRTLSTLLPADFLLKYFWNTEREDWLKLDPVALRAGLRANPPLIWDF